MQYTIIIVLIAFAVIAFFGRRAAKPRESDFEAIDAYARSRNLRVVKVANSSNHWRYWARGRLLLSNLSRVYIVTAESASGSPLEIHIAFDPLSGADKPKVLLEKA